MLSKWQIWDFFSSAQKDYLCSFQGVLFLQSFDSLSMKMVKDHLIEGVPDKLIHYKGAADVTVKWIEEEFEALSFFGGTDNFYIHRAHELSQDLLEKFINLEFSGRFILLSFEQENAAFKKILKEGKANVLSVVAPGFWEISKLLDFVAQRLRTPLSYETKQWLLDVVENDLGGFYNACTVLKLNYPEVREINLTMAKEVISVEKLDQFQMASLFSRKKFFEFFDRLLKVDEDFERLRSLCMFLQTHLIKMLDVGYLDHKPRLTSYDKEIVAASKLWKSQELYREIERFNRWEILSKRKEAIVWHEIKDAHLRVLQN
jgi:DNA polymerase III delta subunit